MYYLIIVHRSYVEFSFLLLRGPYVRLVYLLNMLSSLNKDIIIIIMETLNYYQF